MSEVRAISVGVEAASVHFGAVRAVEQVSLEVAPGAVHVLLGRSGSGKTTLLRAIGGFEPLVAGRILLGDRVVDDGSRRGWVAPEAREIGFVFQDYALFPHLDARGNVAFGIGGPRGARKGQAGAWLERVGLASHAARKPGQLSGGEQQRVALARALAQGPRVLLLDEPFSNLDAHLRRRVRDDTLSLIRESGATAIFVTHDAEEAFAVADALSVMHQGELQQTGTAELLYREPASIHVARLCGAASFVPVLECLGDDRARSAVGITPTTGELRADGLLVVRPEQIRVRPVAAGTADAVEARVVGRRFLGPIEELDLAVEGLDEPLRARRAPDEALGEAPGDRVALELTGPLAAIAAA